MPTLEATQPVAKRRLPTYDGQTLTYSSKEAEQSRYFNPQRRVVFVNGVDNSPTDHVKSAEALSVLTMCPVLGIYNACGNHGDSQNWGTMAIDFLQCLADKVTLWNPLQHIPGLKSISAFRALPANARESAVKWLAGTNRAAGKLFELVRKMKYDIYAHSQGNFLTSNALEAIRIIDGDQSMNLRVVHSFGSPCGYWPAGVKVINYAFRGDPIYALVGGMGSPEGFGRIVSNWGGTVRNGITHGFLYYVQNDPMFVMKRFEVQDLLGVGNPRLEVKDLARCLVGMGVNFGRVLDVLIVTGGDIADFKDFQARFNGAKFSVKAKPPHQFVIQGLCNFYAYYYGPEKLKLLANQSDSGKRLLRFLSKHGTRKFV